MTTATNTRRLPRWLPARLILTATLSGLLALTLLIAELCGAAGFNPAPARGNATGAAQPVQADRVALAKPRAASAAALVVAPVRGSKSLQCAGQPLRDGSDRATATGFQITVVLDNTRGASRGNTNQAGGRGPLVVTCERGGQITILACAAGPHPGRNPASYSDRGYRDFPYTGRSVGYNHPDYLDDWDGFGPQGRDLERLNRLEPDQLRDLIEALNQRRAGEGAGRAAGLQIAGMDINLGGLVQLRHNPGTTRDGVGWADPRDSYSDLYPSADFDTDFESGHGGFDPVSGPDYDAGGYRTADSDRAGVCRWSGGR